MKNAVFATARNEDQAHKVVDHLRTTLGFSTQEISVILPHNAQQQGQNVQQGQQSQSQSQQARKTTNTTQSQHSQQNVTQHGQQHVTSSKGQFPNTSVSLKSLNINETESRKYEESLRAGQYFISAQSDSTEKLDKAQDYFRKEGLTHITSNRTQAQSRH